MNSQQTPVAGPGKFQWNTGGWFGSSLGSSAWMIVTSCFLFTNDQPLVATVPVGGFLLILIASLVLWNRRNRMLPFPALMVMLSLMAFVIPSVWMIVQVYGSSDSKSAMNWPATAWSTVFVVALVPVIMLWFAYLERSATTHNLEMTQNAKTVA